MSYRARSCRGRARCSGKCGRCPTRGLVRIDLVALAALERDRAPLRVVYAVDDVSTRTCRSVGPMMGVSRALRTSKETPAARPPAEGERHILASRTGRRFPGLARSDMSRRRAEQAHGLPRLGASVAPNLQGAQVRDTFRCARLPKRICVSDSSSSAERARRELRVFLGDVPPAHLAACASASPSPASSSCAERKRRICESRSARVRRQVGLTRVDALADEIAHRGLGAKIGMPERRVRRSAQLPTPACRC